MGTGELCTKDIWREEMMEDEWKERTITSCGILCWHTWYMFYDELLLIILNKHEESDQLNYLIFYLLLMYRLHGWTAFVLLCCPKLWGKPFWLCTHIKVIVISVKYSLIVLYIQLCVSLLWTNRHEHYGMMSFIYKGMHNHSVYHKDQCFAFN